MSGAYARDLGSAVVINHSNVAGRRIVSRAVARCRAVSKRVAAVNGGCGSRCCALIRDVPIAHLTKLALHMLSSGCDKTATCRFGAI
jgi:hypothetical protein